MQTSIYILFFIFLANMSLVEKKDGKCRAIIMARKKNLCPKKLVKQLHREVIHSKVN